MSMKYSIRIIAALALCAFLGACSSPEDEESYKVVTFYVGDTRNLPIGVSRDLEILPLSKISVTVDKSAFMYSGDLQRADVAKIKMPDGEFLLGILFTCNTDGNKKLYMATAGNPGGMIVVKCNSAIIAARRIDTLIGDGKIFTLLEITDDEAKLQKLVEDINKTLPEVYKKKEEAKKIF